VGRQGLGHAVFSIVDRFAELRKMAKSDPDQMVSTCEKMLEMHDVETAVRVGDIFAQLVWHRFGHQVDAVVFVWRFGEAINDVTTEALVPELVPPEQFQVASSISSAIQPWRRPSMKAQTRSC